MNSTRLNNRCGFSIIEAMVGTMILGFVLASVLTLASHALGYLTDIRRVARSSQVLQQKMEDIRLMSWSQIQALPGTFRDPKDHAGLYSGTISRSAYDSYGGITTVMKVTLTVTWTNRSEVVTTNTLSTLISNGGLNKYIF